MEKLFELGKAITPEKLEELAQVMRTKEIPEVFILVQAGKTYYMGRDNHIAFDLRDLPKHPKA